MPSTPEQMARRAASCGLIAIAVILVVLDVLPPQVFGQQATKTVQFILDGPSVSSRLVLMFAA